MFQLQLYLNPCPNELFQICVSSFRIFFFQLSSLRVTRPTLPLSLGKNVAKICGMLLENPMKVFKSKKILCLKSGMVVLKVIILVHGKTRGRVQIGLSQNSTKFSNFILLNADKQIVPFESTNKEVSFEWSHPAVCPQT